MLCNALDNFKYCLCPFHTNKCSLKGKLTLHPQMHHQSVMLFLVAVIRFRHSVDNKAFLACKINK